MTTKPKASEVTQDVIDNWKRQYKKIMKWEGGGKVAYFKNPGIDTMDAASALARTNPIKSNMLIARDCFIGGDEDVLDDPEHILALGNHLQNLVLKVEGELSEL